MIKSSRGLYTAFAARDARFDGRFFVGVSSTGIYCRPVCWAKMPKEENCTFFTTAAEAEQAGYRPCLLCRPELAPGQSPVDASAALAHKAAHLLEENCGSGQSLEDLAAQLGCTGRHLRRVFAEEFHVSPVQYLQTCRLLLAKNLLTDTALSVTEVAMAAGFGSLSRFNTRFKEQYQLSPTALRKAPAKATPHPGSITLALGYRPPYQWDKMLDFLAGRAIAGVERVQDGTYGRTVWLKDRLGRPLTGWIEVTHLPKKSALQVTVSETLLPVLPQVLARIRRLFDLYCDPDTVYRALQSMDEIRPGLRVLGTRVPGCFDAFEMAVRTVLGQQITVRAASTLTARLATAYGKPIETGIDGLSRLFPTPADIAALGPNIETQLGQLGVIAARSRTIYALALALMRGEIVLGPCAQPQEEMQKLLQIRGIGSWSAQYMAMRAMQWPDAFLETDAGVKKALAPRSPGDALALAEKWRPWRSYATVSLWNAL
ncbi:AlkA N-terminal domain-containing protein [Neobittarella massiliensis]|uniref:AlkA N-terminal domain-containing protein n=1 Tax=Neobittarella massiliensis (ex Bilen et al. 2018) TaxID=2041842 RepID=UPI000CF70B01|nr:AlkA N-terminal domain-containing protein [Neobittarella massiliensis]